MSILYVVESKLYVELLYSENIWCRRGGFRINPAKATIEPFTRKCKLNHLRAIRLYGIKANGETKVKYLRIKLDQKLLWKNIYNCFDDMQFINWEKTAMLLILRPIITYGAVIWTNGTGNSGRNLRLKPITIIWYTDRSLTTEAAGTRVIGPRKMCFKPISKHSSIYP